MLAASGVILMGVPSAARSGPCATGWAKGYGKPFPPDPDGTVPGSGPVPPGGGAPGATRIATRSVGKASEYVGADPTFITPDTGDSPDGGCQGCCELVLAVAWAGLGEITPGTESSVW